MFVMSVHASVCAHVRASFSPLPSHKNAFLCCCYANQPHWLSFLCTCLSHSATKRTYHSAYSLVITPHMRCRRRRTFCTSCPLESDLGLARSASCVSFALILPSLVRMSDCRQRANACLKRGVSADHRGWYLSFFSYTLRSPSSSRAALVSTTSPSRPVYTEL